MKIIYTFILTCLIFAVFGLQPEHLLANQASVQPPLALPQQQQNSQMMQAFEQPELEDIAGPVLIEEPFPIIYVLCGVGLTLVVLLLLFFLWKKLRNKKTAPTNPATVALEQLNLYKEKLAAHNDDRTYLTEVSDVLRNYIKTRFKLQPTSQTTREFLHSIGHQSSISDMDNSLLQYKDQLQEWFELLDNSKFAHKPMNAEQLEAIDKEIRSFIQSTAPTSREKEGEK